MMVGERKAGETLRLGVFMYGHCNYHVAGWRHPDSWTDAGSNVDRWIAFARRMERAKLDMLFIADGVGVSGADNPDRLSRTGVGDAFEPLTLLGALSAVTERLGLVATCATTYTQPYNVARMFASLDQLAHGRSGWNLVTGGNPDEARNFNMDSFVPATERYAQAEEFADVVLGLWDSFDEGAFIRDKARGLYLRPEAIHTLGHKGSYYKVAGPLGVARSPQGRPVLIQAGKSDSGKNLASRVADLIFTAAATLEEAQAFYADVRARAEAFGRAPGDLKVLPGISVYLGATEAEARRNFEELEALMPIDVAVERLSRILGGVDLSGFELDKPMPPLEANQARMGTPVAYTKLAQAGNLTLRQVALRSATSKDHLIAIGTVDQVVDTMERWFKEAGADGFNLLPHTVPGALDDFIDQVVPELRRRGLFRTEYEGTTLRENLGLPVPASRYAKKPVPVA